MSYNLNFNIFYVLQFTFNILIIELYTTRFNLLQLLQQLLMSKWFNWHNCVLNTNSCFTMSKFVLRLCIYIYCLAQTIMMYHGEKRLFTHLYFSRKVICS